MNTKIPYSGEIQPRPKDEYAKRKIYPYLPSEELVEAVNLAIALNRPLLLKGEPGCGKTKLAIAVAHELKWPYFEWHIKSTSRASDGLYRYDNIGRLRDAQLSALQHRSSENMENDEATTDEPVDVKALPYVDYGPLGQAFLMEERTVVLIDEIDKADIDFPNDLLYELDQLSFVIEEKANVPPIEAKYPPLIIVTSNDEKDLPGAFLRRCIFHYIQFPNRQRLTDIINERFEEPDQEVVTAAIERFDTLRGSRERFVRRPSTSELIDWFTILDSYPQDEALEKLEGVLPFPSVLLKSWDDHLRFLGEQK